MTCPRSTRHGEFGAITRTVHRELARRSSHADWMDVDFLVYFDPDRILLDLSALTLDLEAALGCEVDVKERTGDGRAAERISREAIALSAASARGATSNTSQ